MSKTKKVRTKKKTEQKSIDLSQEIMTKVKAGEINMKPRWYFVLGSSLLFLALVTLIVLAVFLFNVSLFVLRRQGPMRLWRLEMLLSNLPLWIPILAILTLWGGIKLLKKYDFSYKKSFLLIIITFVIAIIAAAWAIDSLGLNEFWSRKEPMRRFYQNLDPNFEGKNFGNKPGTGKSEPGSGKSEPGIGKSEPWQWQTLLIKLIQARSLERQHLLSTQHFLQLR